MRQEHGWRSDQAMAIWWSFAITALLLVEWVPVRSAGLGLLCLALWRGWPIARRDPPMLAFLAFCLVVTALFDYAPEGFASTTVAFTGWNAAGAYCLLVLFVIVALLSGRNLIRRLIAAVLAIEPAFGLFEWLTRWPRVSENPYLAISVWRPLWTVAIPLFWIAIILAIEPEGTARPADEAPSSGPQNNAADERPGFA